MFISEEIKSENGVVVGKICAYDGYAITRSLSNRPGSKTNKLKRLWSATPNGGRTEFKFPTKKAAILWLLS